MKTLFTKTLIIIFSLIIAQVFGQHTISGKITDDQQLGLKEVLVLNYTKNIRSTPDTYGNFSIEADENDELRFVKESYYRTDKIIKKENFETQMNVFLLRVETLIPEVKIEYKPTGNLERDNKYVSDSRKVEKLKSSMEEYMKSPMSEPIPKNEISKTFKGHDFQAGHASLDVIKTIVTVVGLIKNAKSPKITAPTYNETQEFLKRVKNEVDLSFLKKYSMNEEGIDHFLYYAERVNHLSKRFRKTFRPLQIENVLKTDFNEYSKLNKLSGK